MAKGSVQIKRTIVHSEYLLWTCEMQQDGTLRLRFDCRHSNDRIHLTLSKEEQAELFETISKTNTDTPSDNISATA